jgi:GMP synthase (glutamine-hydrolysing)
MAMPTIEPLFLLPLLSESLHVWMSHGDRITRLPEGFVALARSGSSPYAAMGDFQRKYFGVQFHPEVHHTPNGENCSGILCLRFAESKLTGRQKSIIEESVERIRRQVGGRTRAGRCQRRRGFVGGGGAGPQSHR